MDQSSAHSVCCMLNTFFFALMAIALWAIAFSSNISLFDNIAPQNIRYLADSRSDKSPFIGDGANEFPIFNNLGDVYSTQAALAQAAQTAPPDFSSESMQNYSSNPFMEKLKRQGLAGSGVSVAERFVGTGL